VPLYDYQCEAGHRYEKRESFGSPAQQPCEKCGKPARRLLNAPPILFKGSGWYVTDSKRTMRTGVDSPASSTDLADSSSSSSDDAPAATGDGGSDSGGTKKSSSKSSTSKPATPRKRSSSTKSTPSSDS
jgi:putative FmdB family regulatory protein